MAHIRLASIRKGLFGLAMAVALSGQPAAAQSWDSEAEALRRLDIMLMVTSLRCRRGADDFQSDYQRFTAHHLATLNQASRELSADYALRHGERAARRRLDTISTTMANQYGQGHPWLDCAALHEATRRLAQGGDRRTLLAAAGELLSAGPAQSTLVARYGQ